MSTRKLTLLHAVLCVALLTLGGGQAYAQQAASELAALQQRVLADDKLPAGQRLFEERCAICHGGERYHPATRMLEKRDGPDRSSLLARSHLTPKSVKAVVRGGMLEMFPFRRVDLSDEDLDAITNYVAKEAKK